MADLNISVAECIDGNGTLAGGREPVPNKINESKPIIKDEQEIKEQ
jgi:hypothetical protein